MKLYGTIKSDRAQKSQGGNDYLKIIIRDDKQHCIGIIKVKPRDNNRIKIEMDILENVDIDLQRPIQICTDDDTKSQ